MAGARVREARAGSASGYKDPAQVVFESIPPDAPTAGISTVFNIANGGVGNPETIPYAAQRTPDEIRASRPWSAGTNPYNWPMKETPTSGNNWPTRPQTGSPATLTPPPKPPSPTFEIAVEDVVSTRPSESRGVDTVSTEERSRDVSARQSSFTNPMTTMSAAMNEAMSGRREEDATSGSASTHVPYANSNISDEPTTGPRVQPVPYVTPEGRIIMQSTPPSLPGGGPSVSWSSQSGQPALNSSVRPGAPTRPLLNTHVRPTSSRASGQTPVAEIGPPLTPHAPLESSSSHSLASTSQASNSPPPPQSPPPPYSNKTPTTRRRPQAYYAAAEVRSDQIMESSVSASAIHPTMRNERPVSASSTTAPEGSTRRPSASPTSPPTREVRSDSAFTIISDESIGSVLQSTQSAPASVRPSPSPPTSTSPAFQPYRPLSTSSMPIVETRNGAPLSASGYQPYRESRSQSMSSVPQVAELSGSIKRKPVPPKKRGTDTFKEAILETVSEPPHDTLKEVAPQPPVEGLQDLSIDAYEGHSSRHTRNHLGMNLSKERRPVTAYDQIRVALPPQPVSQVELNRKRNLKRRQDGRKPQYQVVNPD